MVDERLEKVIKKEKIEVKEVTPDTRNLSTTHITWVRS